MQDRWCSTPSDTRPNRKPPPPSYQRQDSLSRAFMEQPGALLESSSFSQRMSAPKRPPAQSLKPPPPPPASTASSSTSIELSPGVFLPVLGSKECWDAIERGHCVNAECFVCNALLQCKDNASHFICPGCMTISPLQNTSLRVEAGIALALKTESLLESLLSRS